MYLCTSSSDPTQMRCSTLFFVLRAAAAAEQFGFPVDASADAVAAPQESSPHRPLHREGKEPRKLLGNNRRPSSLSAARAKPAPGTAVWRGGRPARHRCGHRPQQRRRLGSHPAACRPRSCLRQGSFVQLTNGSPAG